MQNSPENPNRDDSRDDQTTQLLTKYSKDNLVGTVKEHLPNGSLEYFMSSISFTAQVFITSHEGYKIDEEFTNTITGVLQAMVCLSSISESLADLNSVTR